MYSPVRITGGASIGISSRASRSRSSSPSRNFVARPSRCMPGAAALDLPAHECVPARLDRQQVRRAGTRCTSRNGLADLGQGRAPLLFRQRRPGLRADHAVQARDDQYGHPSRSPSTHDLGDRDAEPAAKLRQRAALGDELLRAASAGKSSGSALVEPDDEVGAGREHMRRRAADSPWLRAMSIAAGSHRDGSARQARNASVREVGKRMQVIARHDSRESRSSPAQAVRGS